MTDRVWNSRLAIPVTMIIHSDDNDITDRMLCLFVLPIAVVTVTSLIPCYLVIYAWPSVPSTFTCLLQFYSVYLPCLMWYSYFISVPYNPVDLISDMMPAWNWLRYSFGVIWRLTCLHYDLPLPVKCHLLMLLPCWPVAMPCRCSPIPFGWLR